MVLMAYNGELSCGNPRKARLTQDIMIKYLLNPDEFDCILIIYHAKVAQKSYGNEKRFFCPPPCIVVRGNGWKQREDLLRTNLNCVDGSLNFFATISIGKLASQRESLLQFNDQGDEFKTKWDVKSLYISDSDKRKYFNLSVSCFYGQSAVASTKNIDLGIFDSKRIKVISKPSKKRNSTKTPDNKNLAVCIASGTQIALFNRARSQSANTRYLYVEEGKFTANQKRWGAFTIHLIDKHEPFSREQDFFTVDGFINYGSVVKLVDSVTGLSLPRMRIMRVDKNCLTHRSDEPVSQLHKCAFQMLDNEQNFLCFNNDNIIQQPACDNYNGQQINDSAQWTIISTDTTEYRFFEAMGPVESKITPVPTITSISMEASETHLAHIEFIGSNFSPSLKVWLNATEVKTVYICPERICVQMPSLQTILKDSALINNLSSQKWDGTQQTELEVPVCLVRDDGVIFSTQASVRLRNSQFFLGTDPSTPTQSSASQKIENNF